MATITTETTRFCTRCGAELVDGQCPRHDRAARPRWVVPGAVAVGVALLLALVFTSRSTASKASREARASRRETQRVLSRLEASTAAMNGLAARVQKLEGRLDSQPDPGAVAKKVEPSVVTVETTDGLGSGFALRSGGDGTLIVTNFHVVEDLWRSKSRQVKVRQPGHEFTGTVERVDAGLDLALVRIKEPLPVLVRAPGDPAVGDPVIVVGSPFGLENTVSTGIVSALRDGLVQFSAPSSPGNSGGPVVDRSGRVLGVTQKKAVGGGAEGLSFAIPIAPVCASFAIC